MCGRYGLTRYERDKLREEFDFIAFQGMYEPTAPLYNIAPSQTIPAVIATPNGNQLVPMQWGFKPSWSTDSKPGLINARSETAHEKPFFRNAFKSRRCLLPATGFYEWQKTTGKTKQPHWITPKNNNYIALAAIWETHNETPTCAILTTHPNQLMQPIHDRMPVIIPPDQYQNYLTTNDPTPLLKPCPAEQLQATPVSTHVNSPSHNDPLCTQPLHNLFTQ